MKMKMPLKISKVEQRLLLGGVANSLIYWMDKFAQTQVGYPAELKQQLDPHIPNYGDIVTAVAPPATLILLNRMKRKEKLGDLAFGSTLYGIPTLVKTVGVQTLKEEGRRAAPPAAYYRPPQPITRYAVTGNNMNQGSRTVAPSMGKYRVTS